MCSNNITLIVGLGNPGSEYSLTRHNIGFSIIEYLEQSFNLPLIQETFSTSYGTGVLFGKNVVLAKPLTYMNLSGTAVEPLARHFNIAPENILVIHDDMDIEYGKIKIKIQGGSAGQRGIESIIHTLGTDAFMRIRIGIGKPVSMIDAAHYVLENFSKQESDDLKEVIRRTAACIETILTQGPLAAMNQFHTSDC
ncbi:MAG: aminoacyl-tRNA hydrolase [Deltaproteobacteria bacterium]|nr:aminoacyl-tRNA hydrolase [Deltaproteobacteria bacterium]